MEYYYIIIMGLVVTACLGPVSFLNGGIRQSVKQSQDYLKDSSTYMKEMITRMDRIIELLEESSSRNSSNNEINKTEK